jgi:hypothetical protein
VLSHPDWGWVNEKGKQQREPLAYHLLGHSLPSIYFKQDGGNLFPIRRSGTIFGYFGIQFVLYDARGRNPFCFYKYTEAGWNREHPGDPHRAGFNTGEGWERLYQWDQKRTMTDMLDETIAIARKHLPNLLISLNGSPKSFP